MSNELDGKTENGESSASNTAQKPKKVTWASFHQGDGETGRNKRRKGTQDEEESPCDDACERSKFRRYRRRNGEGVEG